MTVFSKAAELLSALYTDLSAVITAAAVLCIALCAIELGIAFYLPFLTTINARVLNLISRLLVIIFSSYSHYLSHLNTHCYLEAKEYKMKLNTK